LQLRKYIGELDLPELAIIIAMIEPMNQHHTAVAGPPAFSGLLKVAGTDPKTPRIEIAYDTVDHFVKWRRNSCTRKTSVCLLAARTNEQHYLFVTDSGKQALVAVLNRGHEIRSGW
jgi:hypothetical protein